MSGASKWLGSGGWRVGFASLPRELSRVRDGLLTAASETFTSVAAPLQYGVVPGFLPKYGCPVAACAACLCGVLARVSLGVRM